MKTFQGCVQAVAENLQHATLKIQRNKEYVILYYLLRLLRYSEKGFFENQGFFKWWSSNYNGIFLKKPKPFWTAKLSHST